MFLLPGGAVLPQIKIFPKPYILAMQIIATKSFPECLTGKWSFHTA
jgi:hypothetical protein